MRAARRRSIRTAIICRSRFWWRWSSSERAAVSPRLTSRGRSSVAGLETVIVCRTSYPKSRRTAENLTRIFLAGVRKREGVPFDFGVRRSPPLFFFPFAQTKKGKRRRPPHSKGIAVPFSLLTSKRKKRPDLHTPKSKGAPEFRRAGSGGRSDAGKKQRPGTVESRAVVMTRPSRKQEPGSRRTGPLLLVCYLGGNFGPPFPSLAGGRSCHGSLV